jgi:hypothetical protein
MDSGRRTSARSGSAACTRGRVGSSTISIAPPAPKAGIKGKCYPSPEYKLSPINWTVHHSDWPWRTPLQFVLRVRAPFHVGGTYRCQGICKLELDSKGGLGDNDRLVVVLPAA